MEEYTDDPEGQSADDLRAMGQKWLARIKASEKRENKWIDQAEDAEKAYLGDTESDAAGKVYDFNILHSNIETMVPAVYNSTPIPDIRERFNSGQETPETTTSMAVAQVIERAISVQADDGKLETELEDVTQDGLLAGRGIIRVRFDADEQEQPGQPVMDQMGQPMIGPDGMPMMGDPQIVMVNERLTFEAVSWRDYREGPAKRWQDVPWVAYQHCIPWEEVQRIQDPALKEALAVGGTDGETEPDADADTLIWEIWCKETAKVYMIVKDSGEVLSMTDDPMGLPGFFPQPEPVQPITATGKRCPVAPFTIYKRLADELERVTKRIAAITDGLKVRGLIVGSAEDLTELAKAGDNELVPVANLEGFAATGGIEKAIAWWPVDRAIIVLRELYASRDQTKAMIYEVTGISDIVRGQGKASETATAQEIKSQWGSLRIRKLQRMIERCARDLFVIAAEIISSKFSPQTLQAMTGIQITPEMAQMLSAPLDHYKIDVESDSTVRADLSRRKGEMSEFLNGTAQFFAAMGPVVMQAPQMAVPVAEIYAAFARQFNLGKQAEDALENMALMAKQAAEQAQQPQEPPQPGPEQQFAMQMADRDMGVKEGKLTLEEKKAEIAALETMARVG
jgi:hypothetical protein